MMPYPMPLHLHLEPALHDTVPCELGERGLGEFVYLRTKSVRENEEERGKGERERNRGRT
jgi:hypothetical protein